MLLQGENLTQDIWNLDDMDSRFDHRGAVSGYFFLQRALPCSVGFSHDRDPVDPPISAARHGADLHRSVPAKGLFPCKRNVQTPPSPT
jgi:hypothetical protein